MVIFGKNKIKQSKHNKYFFSIFIEKQIINFNKKKNLYSLGIKNWKIYKSKQIKWNFNYGNKKSPEFKLFLRNKLSYNFFIANLKNIN